MNILCNAGNDNRLGKKLAEHMEYLNVIINKGLGATSIKEIRTKTNISTNKKSETSVRKLKLPGFLASENTRKKGFILYKSEGGVKHIGALKLQDDPNQPLINVDL